MTVVEKREGGKWILLAPRGERRKDFLVFRAEDIDREQTAVLENGAQRTIGTESD